MWALIQSDGVLKEDIRTQTLRVKTQEEDSYLRAKENDLRRNQACDTLILLFRPPGLWACKILLFKLSSLCYFVVTTLIKLI